MAGSGQKEGAAGRQIRSLMLVLLLGVAFAGGFSGFLLYYYGPTGVYRLKNIMVAPDVLEGLTYDDQNPTTGKPSRYTFDKIVFSHWDAGTRAWSKTAVGLDPYRQFYLAFADETSVALLGEDVVNEFQRPYPSKLMLDVRASSEGATPSKKFQEVDFAVGGDYFRVELHEHGSAARWVYFYHPGIYNKALSLFTGMQVAQ